jgi:predicted nucleotidyltransferase
VLGETERDCLERYCALLRSRLGDELVAIRMFGSAARGDMWPAHSPMHSDVDLLVVTRGEVLASTRDELVDETYPFFLECGRQFSPTYFAEGRLATPTDERTRDFLAQVERDGVDVWSSR